MVKPDKQEIIIDAAIKVFREKGYANTRMADIAQKAGVSYGLVYHYFGSKEVLFDVIVEDWWNSIYTMMEEQKTAQIKFEQKIENIIRFLINTYVGKPDLMAIFVSEVSRSSSYHTARGLSKFIKAFELFQEIMKQGQENGSLRKDIGLHYLTYMFLGSIEAIVSILVLGRVVLSKEKQERILNSIKKVFLEGASK